MMHASTFFSQADVMFGLIEILEEMNPDLWIKFKVPGESRSCLPETATLEDLGIGGPHTGEIEYKELLRLKDLIEQKFTIQFTVEESLDLFMTRKTTFHQMVSIITTKL